MLLSKYFQSVAKELDQIPLVQEKAIIQTSKEYEDELSDLLAAQMNKGLDGTGNPIKPAYTPFTRRKKRAEGKDPNKVTLRDGGDFHRNIYNESPDIGLSFNSSDSKTEELVWKYGEEVLRYNDATLKEAREDYYIPEIKAATKKAALDAYRQ